MTKVKLLIVAIVMLVVGFAAGFVLRPIIAPVDPIKVIATPSPATPAGAAARSVEYFMENLDEARQIMAGCREGTVRGDECANAETAVTTVESQERFRRFRDR